MKKISILLVNVCFLFSYANAQNVGINTPEPTAQLDLTGTLRIRGNGAAQGNVLTSDANGNATWVAPAGSTASQVGFSARLSADISVSSSTTATLAGFTTTFQDGGNNFNAATGIFTAPSAGVYTIIASIGWTSATTGDVVYLTRIVKTVDAAYDFLAQDTRNLPARSGWGTNFNVTAIARLNAGDQVSVQATHTYSSPLSLSSNGSSSSTFSVVKNY